MFAEEDPDVRLAAVKFFDALPPRFLSQRSKKRLKETRAQIASGLKQQWLPAAQALHETLRKDFYLAIAGFSQSYHLGHDRGVKDYLPQVLRPDAALLASVEVGVWQPAEEYEVLVTAVRRCASAKSLRDAAETYYRTYGHLPLTGSVGLAEVVKEWASSHAEADIWEELWAWADNTPSPLPRYHVCAALLANERFVPAGGEKVLWKEIARIAGVRPEGERHRQWEDGWTFRETLAHHYCCYVECLAPGLPADRLMNMVWWLTERFAEVFPQSPRLLKKVRTSTIERELKLSSFMNHLTHPPSGTSGLRYLTRFTQRVWATALLGELGAARWLLERARPAEEDRAVVEGGLLHALTHGYPKPTGEREPPVYGFELPFDRLEPVMNLRTTGQNQIV